MRLDKVIESLLVNCFQKACFLKKFQFPNRVVDVLRLQRCLYDRIFVFPLFELERFVVLQN